MNEVKNGQFENLGSLVWSHVPADVSVNAETAQEKAVEHGFDPEEYKIDSCSFHLAMSKAVRQFHQLRQHRMGRRLGIRENAAGDNIYVVTIVDEAANAKEEKAYYEQTTTGRVNTKTGEATAEGPLADELLAHYRHFCECICDDDVRNFIRRVIAECAGVPKRSTGGIYFVPANKADRLRAASQFVEELASGAKILHDTVWVPVGDAGANERKNICDSVKDVICSEVDTLVASANRVTKRVASIKGYKNRLGDVKEMVALYEDILGKEAEFEEAVEKLAEAETVVSKKIGELQAQSACPTLPQPGESVSVTDAAYLVLQEAGTPLHYREITKRIVEKGWYETNSKTPEISVGAAIAGNIKSENAKFERAGRGMYKIA